MEINIHGIPALVPLTYTWRQIFILTGYLPDDNKNIVKAPNTFVACGNGITYLEHIYEGIYFNTISKNFKQFKGFIAQLTPLVFPTNTSRIQITPLHCYWI